MTRLLIARIVLTAIGIVVWGYGNASNQLNVMYGGMGIVAVALVLRFLPRRWFDGPPR
ncbi:MAG TPA: hypothetical protein VFS59_10095 [Gemmatimonadaceae bacterium]|nr:hypothetical protein [Gemmatimonadaceae bacterium]